MRCAIDGVLGRALVIVAIKNLLLPLLVWGVSIRLGLPPVWQAVMVVMAALPVGINTYLFAERYECGQALAGTAVVVSTAVSVITLSVVLSILAYAFTASRYCRTPSAFRCALPR